MFKIYKNGDTTQSSVVEMVADNRSDVVNLPTTYEVGSACIVTEDSSVWILGNDKKWHEV